MRTFSLCLVLLAGSAFAQQGPVVPGQEQPGKADDEIVISPINPILAKRGLKGVPALPKTKPTLVSQGMKIGDRPSPAYCKEHELTKERLNQDIFYVRHVIPIPNGEVVQRLGFMKGRLETVSFDYDSDDFDTVVTVLSKRLGEPHLTKNETLQNGFGASFLNEQAIWETTGGILHLESQNGYRLGKGKGSLYSQEALRSLQQKQQDGADEAAKKF